MPVLNTADAVFLGSSTADKVYLGTNLVWPTVFSMAGLFASSQEGAWYEAFDISTLFQNSSASTAVTADGDPTGAATDKSGNAHTAVQATSAARPTYNTGPARLSLDKVDDLLTITVPTGGWTGTMVLATDDGTASYGISIDAGEYELGGQYFPGTAIVGALFRDGALSEEDAASVEAYFVDNGATAGYGAVTDLSNYWIHFSEITSFPLVDTSSATSLNRTWYNCSGLTSFPLIDASSATDLSFTWYNCSGLTSFPLITLATSVDLYGTWKACSGLTSFPLIDMSGATRFNNTWDDCTGLASFPANAFDNITTGDFFSAFTNTNLTQTSIDNILVSLVASGVSIGTTRFYQSGGSAPSTGTGRPAIDTLRARGWTVVVTGGY